MDARYLNLECHRSVLAITASFLWANSELIPLSILGLHPSTLRARMPKLGIVHLDTKPPGLGSPASLKVPLNIWRFHQILRLKNSFNLIY